MPLDRSVPHTEIMPLDRSVPHTETLPLDRSAPHTETMPLDRSAPHTETMPLDRSVPHTETLPLDRSAHTETLPLDRSMPHTEIMPLDRSAHTETMPLDRSVPHTETLPLDRSAHTETLPLDRSAHTETMPLDRSMPHTEIMPLDRSAHTETMPLDRSVPHTETLPLDRSAHTETLWVPSTTASNNTVHSGLCSTHQEVHHNNTTFTSVKTAAGRTAYNSLSQQCVVVPRGQKIQLVAGTFKYQMPCRVEFHIWLETVLYITPYRMPCMGTSSTKPIMLSLSSRTARVFLVYKYGNVHKIRPPARVKHDVIDKDGSFSIVIKPVTDTMWTAMTPAFTSVRHTFTKSEGLLSSANEQFGNAWYSLSIPKQTTVMVSFPRFYNTPSKIYRMRANSWLLYRCDSLVELSSVTYSGLIREEFKVDYTDYIPPKALHVTMLVIHTNYICQTRITESLNNTMNMSYSFHLLIAAPNMLGSGLFNCSVSHYSSFQQHLHCNLELECQGGEDEGAHCPFSSPPCDGTVDASGKCYFFVVWKSKVTWQSARSECRKRGGDLAMMKTPTEWAAHWMLYDYGRRWHCAYIGLRLVSRPLMPLYRNTWSWADGTQAFDVSVTPGYAGDVKNVDLQVNVNTERLLVSIHNITKHCSRFICQRRHSSSRVDDEDDFIPRLKANMSVHKAMELGLARCPAGHLVHSFLQCSPGSRCGVEGAIRHCHVSTEDSWWSVHAASVGTLPVQSVIISMFECDNKRGTVPYTLVCDFRPDCSDHSDEMFCRHKTYCGKTFYTCNNGQCIPLTKVCDRKKDCWDSSDENCKDFSMHNKHNFIFLKRKSAPSVITYKEGDVYTQTQVGSFRPCPQYYFQCPQSKNCLPVYLRCNGISDCSQHEDESGCDDHTCTGFYQCNGTTVCLHVAQLCDGVAQCLWQDDEMLCGPGCPSSCLCQGLEFVCRQPFDAGAFTQLRYLDARLSNMTLGDFTCNPYLMYLDLILCAFVKIQSVNLPNLKFLELSKNVITTLDMDVFLPLQELRTVRVTNNPLVKVTGGNSSELHLRLTQLDLSKTTLESFSSEPLKRFISIHIINISFCRVTAIEGKGFQSTPFLKQLDLRGNVIKRYPHQMFETLERIQLIYTDNYKFCCPNILPRGFDKDQCLSPQDEISSCEDLLRSDVYRLSLWLMCLASVVGNLGCLVFRHVVLRRKSVGGFNTFVSSLSVADCMMGVYLCVLGVADQVYQGVYYLYEDFWVSSIPCTVSGVLSLLSSEVSAITICFVTLDRLIVLRFPFSTVRFTKKSATVTCVLIWMTGLTLSLTPLSRPLWAFYSQTGICIPLPVTRQDFEGRDYSFGVMIAFNLVLFLAIAAG